MAATIDNSNAVQATKRKHLGIPEAVFVVRKAELFSLRRLRAVQLNVFLPVPDVTGGDIAARNLLAN